MVDTGSGPWVRRVLGVMQALDPLVVVTGAAAEQVSALLPDSVTPVFNPDFPTGMGSSLAAGLTYVSELEVDAALVMLVDLPDVTAGVIRRVVAAARNVPRQVLARASYHGVPGHPVLLGAEHFAEVIATATGDSGARAYLTSHDVEFVECGDIGSGRDVDRPPRR